MKIILTVASMLALATAASAFTQVFYSWEDDGTVLGVYPDPDLPSLIATCVTSEGGNHVYSESHSLRLEQNDASGTSVAYLAFLWNLQDGDRIYVGFQRFDDTPAALPNVRLAAHWNDGLPGDPYRYDGQAGGNENYGPGLGWDYTDWTWYASGGHTGAVIEARVDGDVGDVVWLDDLFIEVDDPETHIYIQIPGDSPVATLESTLTEVRALFRD